jgi:hypothetical protein
MHRHFMSLSFFCFMSGGRLKLTQFYLAAQAKCLDGFYSLNLQGQAGFCICAAEESCQRFGVYLRHGFTLF